MLAEVEIYHSRPIAPTRRVALGEVVLPVDPAPGFGGVLLAGMVAAGVPSIDPDLIPDVVGLTHDVEDGRRIAQPKLRHRFQVDRVGLRCSTVRLVAGVGDTVVFDFDDLKAAPEQLILGAVYAARRIPPGPRATVLRSVRRSIGWVGPLGADFVAAVSGSGLGAGLGPEAGTDPIGWALAVLGFDDEAEVMTTVVTPADGLAGRAVDEVVVRRRFRSLLRAAHPDHGGAATSAPARIAELTEARRILIGA